MVDIDDEAFKDYVHINLAGRMVESVWFRAFIFFIIAFNSVMIGVQTDPDIEKNNRVMFQVMDYVFLTIFIMEILIKWFYGLSYFGNQDGIYLIHHCATGYHRAFDILRRRGSVS